MARAAALLAPLLLLLGGPTASEAQIYRWTDERGVTNYADGLDSVPERYRAAAVPVGLRNTAPAPAAPAGGGPAAVAPGTQIKFVPGKEIVVDARLNGTTTVKLLLDTGAQRTVINPRALAAAGVALQQSSAIQIRGATGTANVSAVVVDSVEIGQARAAKLAVISHDIEQEGMDGLLGRDFLDRFKVSIDNQDGVVTLSPK